MMSFHRLVIIQSYLSNTFSYLTFQSTLLDIRDTPPRFVSCQIGTPAAYPLKDQLPTSFAR